MFEKPNHADDEAGRIDRRVVRGPKRGSSARLSMAALALELRAASRDGRRPGAAARAAARQGRDRTLPVGPTA